MAENTPQEDMQITENMTSSQVNDEAQKLEKGRKENQAELQKIVSEHNRHLQGEGFTPMETKSAESQEAPVGTIGQEVKAPESEKPAVAPESKPWPKLQEEPVTQ